MFKEYIEEQLNKQKTRDKKIDFLNRVIGDSWKGKSFEFQSNAMGLREEAYEQLKKIRYKGIICKEHDGPIFAGSAMTGWKCIEKDCDYSGTAGCTFTPNRCNKCSEKNNKCIYCK